MAMFCVCAACALPLRYALFPAHCFFQRCAVRSGSASSWVHYGARSRVMAWSLAAPNGAGCRFGTLGLSQSMAGGDRWSALWALVPLAVPVLASTVVEPEVSGPTPGPAASIELDKRSKLCMWDVTVTAARTQEVSGLRWMAIPTSMHTFLFFVEGPVVCATRQCGSDHCGSGHGVLTLSPTMYIDRTP